MNNLELKGKRLLLLGSNLWKDNIKRFAKENGVYLLFAGLYPGELDEIADESYRIDTTDSSVMIPFIKKLNIDGIFMGGSEFIISKSCDYINKLGYPCYCTKEQWDFCQDKRNFKDFCKRYNVPGVPEFGVQDKLEAKDFPVIVKPIDGCASKGINVCYNENELEEAKQKALAASSAKSILIERYIDNGGLTNMVKYVAIDGRYYLEAMGDRYVLNGGLITAMTFYPSKYLDFWIQKIDPMVQNMLQGMGMKNGVIAFQTIPDGDQLYVYECCLRLTGGMTYKMTNEISGHDSFKMLLRHTLTGSMGNEEDILKINPYFNGKKGTSLTIPLKVGKIGRVEGVDTVRSLSNVVDYTHYYKIGDVISQNKMNTLDQLFARVMVVDGSAESLFSTLNIIRNVLKVEDEYGNNMIIWDTYDRIYQEYCSRN